MCVSRQRIFPKSPSCKFPNKRYPFLQSQGQMWIYIPHLTNTCTTYIQSYGQGRACARARAVEIQAGKAEVGSPLAGSQVRARRYTRTRLASTGVPGGARRQPRTDVDTKPRPELLRTTVQRACVPRPDHGGPSEWARSRKSIFLIDHYRRVTSFRERERRTSRRKRSWPTNLLVNPCSWQTFEIMIWDYADWLAMSSSSSSWQHQDGELVTWLSRRGDRCARSFRQF